jgi:hypothetical protein
MVRDTEDGKTDYTLILDGPMFDRWAEHMTKGAKKYARRNWMQATGEAELERFERSALRHFLQWLRGDRDEDHAAAVIFNINGAEYVRERSMDDIVLQPEGEVLPEPVTELGPGARVRTKTRWASELYDGRNGTITTSAGRNGFLVRLDRDGRHRADQQVYFATYELELIGD